MRVCVACWQFKSAARDMRAAHRLAPANTQARAQASSCLGFAGRSVVQSFVLLRSLRHGMHKNVTCAAAHAGVRACRFTRELCFPRTRFSLADALVLVGGAIPPVPAVPASTRISTGLNRVQEHSSHPCEAKGFTRG